VPTVETGLKPVSTIPPLENGGIMNRHQKTPMLCFGTHYFWPIKTGKNILPFIGFNDSFTIATQLSLALY